MTGTSLREFEAAVASGLGTWPEGTVLLAAVSGGADSTALLAVLSELRQAGGYKLHCLHVEHGIRPREESRGDAEAVRDLCKHLDVPYRLRVIPPGTIANAAKQSGLGLEGTARIFRHRAWTREAQRIQAARVLVAHTQDDLLETALMRFLRGSGPRGLAAMNRERGLIVRPLLALTRSEVLGYLAKRGMGFRTDATNADIRYLRNRIRHKLIPCLDTLFPGWKSAVLKGAQTQGLLADFLAAEAHHRVLWACSPGNRGMVTDWAAFFSQPPIIREEALFQVTDTLVRRRRKTKGLEPDWVKTGWSGTGSVPRRGSLRLFATGGLKALDAGPLRIEKQGALVSCKGRDGSGQPGLAGFALVIREPGVYRFRGVRIACTVSVPEETARGKKAFGAYLPVVFRGAYPAEYKRRGIDPVSSGGHTGKSRAFSSMVEDANGPLAFMDPDTGDCTMVVCRPEQVLQEHIRYETLCREEQGKPPAVYLVLS